MSCEVETLCGPSGGEGGSCSLKQGSQVTRRLLVSSRPGGTGRARRAGLEEQGRGREGGAEGAGADCNVLFVLKKMRAPEGV